MRNALRLLPALVVAATLSGCYMNLAAPTPNLTVKLTADTSPREGSATCTQFLWVFGTGDCSVDTAMQIGHITKVNHVDAKAKTIFFGAYSELTLVVHGE